MKDGYARVSTDGQSVGAQVAALRKHGAGKVFREVGSGAKTNRAQLRRVIGQQEAGDLLMVTRLDELARSTRDLLNTLAGITDRKAGSARSSTHGPIPPPQWGVRRSSLRTSGKKRLDEVAFPAHVLQFGQRGDLRIPVEHGAAHGAPLLHHRADPRGGDRIEFHVGCLPFILQQTSRVPRNEFIDALIQAMGSGLVYPQFALHYRLPGNGDGYWKADPF
jgi:Resolvase, N terminal domain